MSIKHGSCLGKVKFGVSAHYLGGSEPDIMCKHGSIRFINQRKKLNKFHSSLGFTKLL